MAEFSTSPSQYGHINKLARNPPSPLPTRTGTLNSLIRARSNSHSPMVSPPRLRHGPTFSSPADEEAAAQSPRDLHDPFRASQNKRLSEVLTTPQMRSMRLIGNCNSRYKWERYWKTEEELKKMKKPIRDYYKRNNSLIQQYIYIDRLLDSSLPHNLLNEYTSSGVIGIIREADESVSPDDSPEHTNGGSKKKVRRTPRDLYRVPTEDTPLLHDDSEALGPTLSDIPGLEDDSVESGDTIVQTAIYVNLAANTVLLLGKIVVMMLTNSLSVLASLVDAALDFLSTAIVWTTAILIARQDQYRYPIGRRKLEPVGVLVFSVVMITSFFQVAIECFSRLTESGDHEIIELGIPALAIMISTVVIKALCWFWCRLIKNSSVQALAQDAQTDVVFNVFSIIFPIVGFYAKLWWFDALGGLLLSLFVMSNWAGTSTTHIRNLTGAASTADERNVLLYLTMRFARTIKQIQGLQVYHSGDKLNAEVDIVLDESMSLKDSHDLGESLQYVLESVPVVDRAFVHLDYLPYNLPSHLEQQAE